MSVVSWSFGGSDGGSPETKHPSLFPTAGLTVHTSKVNTVVGADVGRKLTTVQKTDVRMRKKKQKTQCFLIRFESISFLIKFILK